jgi:uncharacterized sporulation protein YeaH/YhbH (DUF444 family)
LTHLIDRRLQGKNKSAVNRERFLRRYKGQIKDAVGRAIKGRSITDVENGEKVSIPVKDVNEPTFGHAHGGVWEVINPGNQEYLKGDMINRPKSGGGSGRGKAGNSDQTTEDDFIFELSREEFMNYFFEDLELPHMVKTQLTATTEFKLYRIRHPVQHPRAAFAARRTGPAHCRRRQFPQALDGSGTRIDSPAGSGRAAGRPVCGGTEKADPPPAHTAIGDPVHRSVRPALQQPHQGAETHDASRDVLHHGRVRLHG